MATCWVSGDGGVPLPYLIQTAKIKVFRASHMHGASPYIFVINRCRPWTNWKCPLTECSSSRPRSGVVKNHKSCEAGFSAPVMHRVFGNQPLAYGSGEGRSGGPWELCVYRCQSLMPPTTENVRPNCDYPPANKCTSGWEER